MPIDLFTGLFFLAFFIILAMIVVQFVRGIAQWGRNNASPRLTVEATVVAKRERTCAIRTTTAPPTMPPSRWRAATGWSCPCAAPTTACWPRATAAG